MLVHTRSLKMYKEIEITGIVTVDLSVLDVCVREVGEGPAQGVKHTLFLTFLIAFSSIFPNFNTYLFILFLHN